MMIDRMPPAPEGLFKAYRALQAPTPFQLESAVEFHADHFWRRFLWRHYPLIVWILIAALVIIFAAWDALRAPPAHGAEQQIVEWDGVTAEQTITFSIVDADGIIAFMDFAGVSRMGDVKDPVALCGTLWKPLGLFKDRLGRNPDKELCFDPDRTITHQQAIELCLEWELAFVSWAPPNLTCRKPTTTSTSAFQRVSQQALILFQRTLTAAEWDKGGGKTVKDMCTMARGILREHWYVLEGPERKPETYILAVCVRLKPALQPELPLPESKRSEA